MVTPGLAPLSTSILLTQDRKVSGVQPILAATDCIAAQRDLCSYATADSPWHVAIHRIDYDRNNAVFLALVANDDAIGDYVGHSRNLNLLTFGAF